MSLQRSHATAEWFRVTPPRFITEGMIFYVTVRAVNRSFRFVPKRQVREAIDYALSVVLQRYREAGMLSLHEFEFMSNHYHLLGTDKVGCLPDFIRDLNSLLSRELNAIRGISGTNFEEYNLVHIVGAERIVEHAVYTLANPVRAFLVEKARHWKGTSSLALEYGVPVVVEKPRIGLWAGKLAHAERHASRRSKRAKYAGRSKLPAAAALVIDRPLIMLHLSDSELRAEIREQLARREREIANERKRRGIRVLGWAKVVARHFLSLPGRTEELFSRTPGFSASSSAERVAMAALQRTFRELYRLALELFVADKRRDIAFPEGTWLMRRRYGVRCVPITA
jgi:putative transposase